jgi:hypothetical protein
MQEVGALQRHERLRAVVRAMYRRHSWRSVSTEIEALRCVHAAENALWHDRTAQATEWIYALQKWILRDHKLGGEEPFRSVNPDRDA